MYRKGSFKAAENPDSRRQHQRGGHGNGGKNQGSFTGTLKDTTKLIIAQRITSVMNADQIVVMDEGKIVGLGRHEELLAGCEAYQEIYYSQMDREVSAS